MAKLKTLILVTYNDSNGDDFSNEIIVESEKDFKRWLKERNKERVSDGEMEESENEFTLQYIKLIQY
jgi:heme/copper-type cytochrome/quinol oxidase subunit 2